MRCCAATSCFVITQVALPKITNMAKNSYTHTREKQDPRIGVFREKHEMRCCAATSCFVISPWCNVAHTPKPLKWPKTPVYHLVELGTTNSGITRKTPKFEVTQWHRVLWFHPCIPKITKLHYSSYARHCRTRPRSPLEPLPRDSYACAHALYNT